MKTLFATRMTETEGLYKGFKKTILKNSSGKIVATYPAGILQPSKRAKTIVHNCWKYKLVWQ